MIPAHINLQEQDLLSLDQALANVDLHEKRCCFLAGFLPDLSKAIRTSQMILIILSFSPSRLLQKEKRCRSSVLLAENIVSPCAKHLP
jgi:hypothetical protein